MLKLAATTIAFASVILAAGLAHAGSPMSTAPIPKFIPGFSFYQCMAANTGTKTVIVSIEIVNADTGVVISSSSDLELAPGRGLAPINSTSAFAYCRVTGLSKKSGTVTFAAKDGSGNVLMATTVP